MLLLPAPDIVFYTFCELMELILGIDSLELFKSTMYQDRTPIAHRLYLIDFQRNIFVLSHGRYLMAFRCITYNGIVNLIKIIGDWDNKRPGLPNISEVNNAIVSYASEGHKIRAMRKHDRVSLEVAEIDSVNNWKSILVQGTFEQHEGSEAKALLHEFSLGVKDLIIKKEGRTLDFISDFSSKIYRDDIPVIYTIKVEEITGRMRLHECWHGQTPKY